MIAADHALQLGELADHAGDEIGLGEPRGALDLRRQSRAAPMPLARPAIARASRPARPCRRPCRAFRGRRSASSFFACSSSGTLRSCSQKNLASDRRAASTLRLPATIAAPPSDASILATQTKSAASVPSRRRSGEIFLVGAHGELDHLARHVEEGRVEAAEQRHRPFGQPGILGDQAFVLDQGQAAPRPRARAAPSRDDPAALVGIDDDVAGAQLLRIVVGVPMVIVPGMVEAVADASPRPMRCRRSRSRRPPRRAGRRCPAAGAPSAGSRSRRGVAPAHRLGPGKGADDGRDRFGEHLGGGAAGLLDRWRTRCRRARPAGPRSGRSCAGSLRAPAAAPRCAGP